MLTKQDIFQTIIDHKETIKSFGVTEMGLFGSYVRDEQNEVSDIDLLQHIKFESDFLLRSSANLTEQKFYKSETYKRAFIRSLAIINKASNRLNINFKQKFQQINWNELIILREKLFQDYNTIDYHLVWQTIVIQIPKLDAQLKQILRNHNKYTNSKFIIQQFKIIKI